VYSVRLWTVRHARLFERVYYLFEPVIVRLHPLWSVVGYARAERPVAAVERLCKGLLFDCRMCGQCALSSSGMSCPMNCPKNLRNGPCGGVRPDGHCEVHPEYGCVWVEAWNGSRRMDRGDTIFRVQKPVDFSLQGHSSWLRVARMTMQERQAAGGSQ